MANKLIIKRTSQSSIASFVAGIPGGLAMAATIPADIMQFFGMVHKIYGLMVKLTMKELNLNS